jgi:RNA exonuclease 4
MDIASTAHLSVLRRPSPIIVAVYRASLNGAPDFDDVGEHFSSLLRGRILIGHSVHMDLKALQISHDSNSVRDVADWHRHRDMYGSPTPSLRKMAQEELGMTIQAPGIPHDPVEDARAAMALYRRVHTKWKRRAQKGYYSGLGPN